MKEQIKTGRGISGQRVRCANSFKEVWIVTFFVFVILIAGCIGVDSTTNKPTGETPIQNNVTLIQTPIPSSSHSIHGVVISDATPLKNATATLVLQFDNNGKTYRYSLLDKNTGADGAFSFPESEIKAAIASKLGDWKFNGCSFFIEVYKKGYMDQFVYDYDETPKHLEGFDWNVGTITLLPLKPYQILTDERFVVKYRAGQETCANIAMLNIKKVYPKVSALLGAEPLSNTTTFTFNTIPEQGWGDWWGSQQGISTVCYPWTDDINNDQIADMWNSAIPHELSHHFVSGFSKPYWAEEGLAQYVSKTINNDSMDCNGPFVSLNTLNGENMPAYDSAACAFHMLEQQKQGFVKTLVARIRVEGNKCYSKSGYFIKSIMSDVFGSDLTDYFVGNFGFENTGLEEENSCDPAQPLNGR